MLAKHLIRCAGQLEFGLSRLVHGQRARIIAQPISNSGSNHKRTIFSNTLAAYSNSSLYGVQLDTEDKVLHVGNGNDSVSYPLLWLRDHCRCSQCYDPKTFQKLTQMHRMSERQLSVKHTRVHGDNLSIWWKDGHVTDHSLTRLWMRHFYNWKNGSGIASQPNRVLWDRERMEATTAPAVSFSELVDGAGADRVLDQLLNHMVTYGFAFINETPASVESTRLAVERVGPVLHNYFGSMWTVSNDMEKSDSAWTNQHIPPHTDGNYFQHPPGVQVFHCIKRASAGGETILMDGFSIANRLSRRAFDTLAHTPLWFEYRDHLRGVHFKQIDMAIKLNPHTGKINQIRHNSLDLAEISTVRPDQMTAFYSAYSELMHLTEDPDNRFVFNLEPGSVLLLDNYRVLHGRNAFDGNRMLCGCYIGRDEFTNAVRTRIGKELV